MLPSKAGGVPAMDPEVAAAAVAPATAAAAARPSFPPPGVTLSHDGARPTVGRPASAAAVVVASDPAAAFA
jgi:hypothetical protein